MNWYDGILRRLTTLLLLNMPQNKCTIRKTRTTSSHSHIGLLLASACLMRWTVHYRTMHQPTSSCSLIVSHMQLKMTTEPITKLIQGHVRQQPTLAASSGCRATYQWLTQTDDARPVRGKPKETRLSICGRSSRRGIDTDNRAVVDKQLPAAEAMTYCQ